MFVQLRVKEQPLHLIQFMVHFPFVKFSCKCEVKSNLFMLSSHCYSNTIKSSLWCSDFNYPQCWASVSGVIEAEGERPSPGN